MTPAEETRVDRIGRMASVVSSELQLLPWEVRRLLAHKIASEIMEVRDIEPGLCVVRVNEFGIQFEYCEGCAKELRVVDSNAHPNVKKLFA
jgi:hypothetical protein